MDKILGGKPGKKRKGKEKKGKKGIREVNFLYLDKEGIEGKWKENKIYKILNKLNIVNNNTHDIV